MHGLPQSRKIFIDETGLTLPELEATRIREVLEDLLDLLAAARPHPDEPVARSREIWSAPIRPGLSFCELVFPATLAPPLLRDQLRRLAHALDRLPEWEEQSEPDQLEVVLDGELSVLDEEGTRIIAEKPQQHARIGRLRVLGVESSSERGTTRSNSRMV